MNIPLLIHTVRHLTPSQIYYQIRNRFVKEKYVLCPAPVSSDAVLRTAPIPKYPCWDGQEFSFLNIASKFTSWTDMSNGALWAYNLNYFEWLEQMPVEEACQWMDRYIADFPSNTVGQDPYPTALRTLNWVKFFAAHPECRTKERVNLLYSQYRQLERRIEYHLLGNHILEDAYALVVGAVVFDDNHLWRKSSKLLRKCLSEQTLPDGANYEQSPMYHCILLDRLLDVYNVSVSNHRFDDQQALNACLESVAVKMLGHLESIIWKDGSIPLLNDSAYGIAPVAADIFDYARRLGLTWNPFALKECGYRHYKTDRLEAVVDAGNVTAKDQPSHTHADTFNYELRIDGKPFIVDTGISTYNKTARRQYERSTAAHNTVEVDGRNSSEVWAGFRVGKRARVTLIKDCDNHLEAYHNGYGVKVLRTFDLGCEGFVVKDVVEGDGQKISYIHFAPGVEPLVKDGCISTSVADISVEGADVIEIVGEKVSTSYNRFDNVKVAKIMFTKELNYKVSPR